MEPECSMPFRNSPPLDPNLSQVHSVQTLHTYFPKMHSNIILPPTPRTAA